MSETEYDDTFDNDNVKDPDLGVREVNTASKKRKKRSSLKETLNRLNIPREDYVILRICGFVNLACAAIFLFDILNGILNCKNAGCGTGISLLIALLPTIISSLCGGTIFINIQLKLRKLSHNKTLTKQVKKVKDKILPSFWMLLSPIFMFIMLVLVLS